MRTRHTAENEVVAAANALVAAFAVHDTDRYFDSFAPEATFLFHSLPRTLRSREEYRTQWHAWEDAGFRVLACTSSDQQVQLLAPNLAVFTHRVQTCIADADGTREEHERETIVFSQRTYGQWLAVHEHLSPAPLEVPGTSPA